MTTKISFFTAVVGAALVFAVPAFGDAWGTDRNQETVRVSPDLVDRAAAVRQQELSSMLDARERSLRSEERGNENLGARSDSRQSLPACHGSHPDSRRHGRLGPCDRLAADRDRVRRRHPAGDRPLPGDAGDPGPPTRALINGQSWWWGPDEDGRGAWSPGRLVGRGSTAAGVTSVTQRMAQR